MKRIRCIFLVSILFFVFLGLPNHSFADRSEVFLDNGKIENGRMLIPLRAVSEEFGAKITWNQKSREIKLEKGDRTVLLTAGSREVLVQESKNWAQKSLLEVPAQIEKGVTYVPVRFLTYSLLKAQIKWDQKLKQATVVSDGKSVIIQGHSAKVVQAPKVSDERLRTLLIKVNEATDLSSFPQIREYFRPYFTDPFINELIRKGGLVYDYHFKVGSVPTVSPTGDVRALLTQSNEFETDDYTFLHRSIGIVKTPDGWKINSMVEAEYERRY